MGTKSHQSGSGQRALPALDAAIQAVSAACARTFRQLSFGNLRIFVQTLLRLDRFRLETLQVEPTL
jgi:hypothetical protein